MEDRLTNHQEDIMAITKPVNLYHDAAYAGQVADLQLANRVSKLNTTEEVIPCGTAVQADGADGCKPIATGGTVIGVVVRELTNDGVLGIKAGRTGTVLTTGVIWVKAGEDITLGDTAYAGVGANVLGTFTKSAGSDVTEAIATTAKWLDAPKNGELGRISFTIGG